MLRSTRQLVSRTQASSRTRVAPATVRYLSNSPITRDGASKQGMGGKEPIKEENPVSARAEGVKNAAKSVLDGAKGAAQKVTGTGEGSTSAMDFVGKNPREEQVEIGRKAGLEKKGEEQGGL
ncbi:hypothetical protein JCM11491_004617 [Sporobolomyces phaffii]